jgi:hypothetical protein
MELDGFRFLLSIRLQTEKSSTSKIEELRGECANEGCGLPIVWHIRVRKGGGGELFLQKQPITLFFGWGASKKGTIN